MRYGLRYGTAVVVLAVMMALPAYGLRSLGRGASANGLAIGTSATAAFRAHRMLATRYHLRNRTETFFERSSRTSRVAPPCPPVPASPSGIVLMSKQNVGSGRGGW